MLFAGGFAGDVGIRPFGYLTSMVVTIALWLTLAPAIGAPAPGGRESPSQSASLAARALSAPRVSRGALRAHPLAGAPNAVLRSAAFSTFPLGLRGSGSLRTAMN
jgi:hypothetical protein